MGDAIPLADNYAAKNREDLFNCLSQSVRQILNLDDDTSTAASTEGSNGDKTISVGNVELLVRDTLHVHYPLGLVLSLCHDLLDTPPDSEAGQQISAKVI